MKHALLIPLAIAAAAISAGSFAQNSLTIYRCSGNVYTNDAAEARSKGCKTLEGGNITVVQGTRVNSPPVRVANAPQASGGSGQRKADEVAARAATSVLSFSRINTVSRMLSLTRFRRFCNTKR